MQFTRETISYIAHLARLSLENNQNDDAIAADLTRIVAMVDQISAANTENILPMAHPLEMIQRLRPDSVTEADARDALLALAPKKAEAGLFLVPTVLE
jgi:aspartyl-tRNA(Asn)/glutamyl-tRNA(Gln) amidotransferase subunit C